MAIKKSDLYSFLWASCDELRGGMDASQYKDYVLFMLFIKYISDKYGDSDDFAPSVIIPAGGSFKDMIVLKGKSDIGDKINTRIIQPLIDANARLARSDFPDFNDPNKLGEGQAMVDRLSNLVAIFQKPELDFSKNRAEHDDILGDAYEYLMRHFATENGKSKGQFYTPSEVSRVIAQVIGISPQNAVASTTAYDPTCGSGSLLLKVAAQAGKHITLEGQEKNVTTAGLARMNMILHDFPTANILSGNTLSNPKFKDGNKNRLREQDIHRIVDTFRKQAEVSRYARMVPFEEIADKKNDYNLNLPRYIDSTEPEDIQDIDGHLRGGIPARDIDALNAYWQVLPGVRDVLLQRAGRPGYSDPRLPIAEVKPAIGGHAEFTAFNEDITKLFTQWREANTPRLTGFDKDDHPKALIETIAEDLLATFRAALLLDAYDVYQHLMDYWAETMQDDCYLISADGWVAETHRVVEEVKSGKKKGEMKDKGWACDLVPKPYIVARYFAKEQANIEAFQTRLETVNAGLGELSEEHGGDEGVLKDVATKADAQAAYAEALVALWDQEDKLACAAYSVLGETANAQAAHLRALGDQHWLSALKNTKGKLTLKAVKDRLSRIPPGEERTALCDYLDADKKQKEASREARKRFGAVESGFRGRLTNDPLLEGFGDLQITVRYLELLDEQTELKGKLKAAAEALDRLAYEKYAQLTEAEVKTLVVDDKWLSVLGAAVQGELDRVSQRLTGRVRELAERYDRPLPQLTDEVELLAERVGTHLTAMG